jgi:hypothetical protein
VLATTVANSDSSFRRPTTRSARDKSESVHGLSLQARSDSLGDGTDVIGGRSFLHLGNSVTFAPHLKIPGPIYTAAPPVKDEALNVTAEGVDRDREDHFCTYEVPQ